MSDPNRLITQAMAVLEEAHAVADAIRADAERQARDRRTEADLLLAKARRVLLAAESKADAIVAAARSGAVEPDRAPAEERTVIDLDALTAAVAAEDEPARADADAADAADATADGTSSLDRLLDAAIARAVTQALPPRVSS